MMSRVIVIFLSLSWLSLSTWSSVELQKDSHSEVQSTIIDQEKSDLYGAWLFSGGFINASFTGINPRYKISQGDTLLLQLWGGIDFQGEVKVDAQGNVFIPKVGPVAVQGVENSQLNKVILKSVNRIYKSNVEAYVSLVSSQYVKVFLSGMVKKPGLYEGQSADSILRFIDQAGGIREDIGGFRQVFLKRGKQTVAKIDLYNFLTHGEMPVTQLQDGDVIFIGPKKGEVYVEGAVGYEGRFELSHDEAQLSDILAAVVATEKATHVTLVETQGKNIDARQIAIHEINNVSVTKGSKIKVSSQQRANNISVEVLGEHASAQELVLPWGASLSDVLDQINYTDLSDKTAVQLFRQSIADRQKAMLESSLATLEKNVLKTPSSTNEAAQLRQRESELVLAWIQKARSVKPKGQVLLSGRYDPTKVILQQGDKIVVPSKKNLVLVHGDVLFPTAVAYEVGMNVASVIKKTGGVEGNIRKKRILVMSPDGSFKEIRKGFLGKISRKTSKLNPGDEVFVLPEPDVKSLQLTKDISQVIYQIAVSAAVVLSL